jgi:hypothetical protein
MKSLLSLIFHEAYTTEFFSLRLLFYHNGRSQVDEALDGLGVVSSFDDFDP